MRENGEVRRRGEPYLTDEYDATRADLQHERERAADQVDRLENDIERIEAQLREKRAALAEVDLVVVREGHEANYEIDPAAWTIASDGVATAE